MPDLERARKCRHSPGEREIEERMLESRRDLSHGYSIPRRKGFPHDSRYVSYK